MHQLLKKTVISLLRYEATAVLRKRRPRIIAITGNVGKTSTKDAIYTVLEDARRTGKSHKSFNSEIGVPLAILGVSESGWRNPLAWVRILTYEFYRAYTAGSYPDILVLEVGVEYPGDMRQITQWLKPDVAVVTQLGAVPVHIEFFESREQYVLEKRALIEALDENGVAILNADDEDVLAFRDVAPGRVVTYGFSAAASLKASEVHTVYNKKEIPEGIGFKVSYQGTMVPVVLSGTIGRQYAYTALAALAAGLEEGVNVIEMIDALAHYEIPPGRGRFNVGGAGRNRI
jgi:UDP-N-acetylmuramoyl-tripeptide--D-alanyl-D-alanine ligase